MTFPYALSDRSGQSDFLEMAEDPTGRTPFLPETSRLAHPKEAVSKANAEIYKVETRTLDEIAPELDLGRDSKLVCKIDVEAFEHQVLKGGQKTIKEHRPFLSIDLQFHPGTDVLTDKACMEILRPLGYEFEHLGHVMIAMPK